MLFVKDWQRIKNELIQSSRILTSVRELFLFKCVHMMWSQIETNVTSAVKNLLLYSMVIYDLLDDFIWSKKSIKEPIIFGFAKPV